jgi:hypothetical protein
MSYLLETALPWVFIGAVLALAIRDVIVVYRLAPKKTKAVTHDQEVLPINLLVVRADRDMRADISRVFGRDRTRWN